MKFYEMWKIIYFKSIWQSHFKFKCTFEKDGGLGGWVDYAMWSFNLNFVNLFYICLCFISGNAPDIFLLHLQVALYGLFHRLYGMFPYTFLTYLRHHYSKKENAAAYEDSIKVCTPNWEALGIE